MGRKAGVCLTKQKEYDHRDRERENVSTSSKVNDKKMSFAPLEIQIKLPEHFLMFQLIITAI